MRIIEEVEEKNIQNGFDTVEACYAPQNILKHYGYQFPDFADLPPAYTMCPFEVRNGAGDEAFDFIRPPWIHAWYGANGQGSLQRPPPALINTPRTTRVMDIGSVEGVAYKKRSRYDDIEDDEHFGKDEASSESSAPTPGSTPSVSARALQELQPNHGRRKKIRRALVLDEASCSDEVCVSNSACN